MPSTVFKMAMRVRYFEPPQRSMDMLSARRTRGSACVTAPASSLRAALLLISFRRRAAQVRSRQLNALGMQTLRGGRGPAALEVARRLFALALKAWPLSTCGLTLLAANALLNPLFLTHTRGPPETLPP